MPQQTKEQITTAFETVISSTSSPDALVSNEQATMIYTMLHLCGYVNNYGGIVEGATGGRTDKVSELTQAEGIILASALFVHQQ